MAEGTWRLYISAGNEENVWLLSLVAFLSSLSSSRTRAFVASRVTPGSRNAIHGGLVQRQADGTSALASSTTMPLVTSHRCVP